MLRVDGQWVWDSWWVDDGERHHLFHLTAPASLGDPGLRHEQARVGHAVSTDLVTWESLADALGPRPGEWDDQAIWTGCTVRGHDGGWRMFYTALGRRRLGLDQRVGVAFSDDLETWARPQHQPLLSADPRWYRTLADDPGGDGRASETWRDPFVFRDPEGDGWHLVLAARDRTGEPGDDGVLGHARSVDLETWEVQPPLSSPGAGFSQLEVPQVHELDGRWVLLFSGHPSIQTEARLAAHATPDVAAYCLWAVVADSPLGPWDVTTAQPFTADPRLFAAPLARRRDGQAVLLGFRHVEEDGVLPEEITDPVPVGIRDGVLVALAP